ncbi:Glycosyl hydrolase [Aspergillus sp. HF37]|nr:Glycosyl hydrolase [Aspergillus sp. HF37]
MKWPTLAQLACLPALAQCAAVSDEAQVGYHVIFSYPGLQPPSHLFDLIKQGKVGGIILFGENIDDNVADVVQNFQDTYTQSPEYAGSPLLIVSDQEGGQVNRLPGGPELSAKQIGSSPNPADAAAQAGKEAANTLKAAKNNANLAPVLGVYREPGNFLDQYGRSFSNDSEVVSKCAASWITAQQSAGVIATAKHFPGLGIAEAEENTDLRPVTISAPLDTLRGVDEAPYHEAMSSGVDMIMAAWAVYPSMDAKNPAGLSSAWIQDELRGRLQFQGVTITDAIEAGGLEHFGDDANRGLLATQAGMDILLASGRNVTQGEVIVNRLVSELGSGSVSRKSFETASDRILNLRKKL